MRPQVQALQQPSAQGVAQQAAYQNYPQITVAAGQKLDVAITGKYLFVVASNAGTFGIGINDGPSAQVSQGTMIRMQPGLVFSKVTIDNTGNPGALVVQLGYGLGEVTDVRSGTTRTRAGNGGIAQAASPEGVLGGSNAAVAPGAAGVTTLLAPGSNVNGCWLRTAQMFCGSNSTQLYADTAAPAAWGDTTKRCIGTSGAGCPFTLGGGTFGALFLPPGVGIFIAANGAADLCSVTYDLA